MPDGRQATKKPQRPWQARPMGQAKQRARWERVPARGPLWLLPPGPDQVRGVASPAPIQRAGKHCTKEDAEPLSRHENATKRPRPASRTARCGTAPAPARPAVAGRHTFGCRSCIDLRGSQLRARSCDTGGACRNTFGMRTCIDLRGSQLRVRMCDKEPANAAQETAMQTGLSRASPWRRSSRTRR